VEGVPDFLDGGENFMIREYYAYKGTKDFLIAKGKDEYSR